MAKSIIKINGINIDDAYATYCQVILGDLKNDALAFGVDVDENTREITYENEGFKYNHFVEVFSLYIISLTKEYSNFKFLINSTYQDTGNKIKISVDLDDDVLSVRFASYFESKEIKFKLKNGALDSESVNSLISFINV